MLALVLAMPIVGSAEVPGATPDTASRAPGTGWQVADVRELDIGVRYAALSPNGQNLAGVGPDDRFCIWDVATLESECAGEEMPIHPETITWSPDGTAVAFALDTIPPRIDSDIYVYDRGTGALRNLTDDGVEGVLEGISDDNPPIDDVPTWSPDSQQLAFVRSFHGDGESATTAIMRVDRNGGEPVPVALLNVAQSLAVSLPIYWLPDDTLVYTQNTNDIEDPNNGVWMLDVVAGGSPALIVPGGEGSVYGGPMVISDIAGGKAIIFAYWLAGDIGFGGDRPMFFLVDLATGGSEPLPPLPEADGQSPQLVDATFSPDGATILLVTTSLDGAQLMALDVATGAISPLEPEPRDGRYLSGVPQWVSSNTVLLQRMDGPMLFSLVPTGTPPAASPAAGLPPDGAPWRIVAERSHDLGGRDVVLSPNGGWLAGIGPEVSIASRRVAR